MKTTKAQLEQDLHLVQQSESALHLALNDVLNDRTTWFRRGVHRLGISRENGPQGGIVIHRCFSGNTAPYAVAYYWEQWFSNVKYDYGSNDKDVQDLRLCALDAQQWINKQQQIAA